MREKKEISFHFGGNKKRGKEEKGRKENKRKSVELEEEGHFSRGKGLISHDYGCMWFYAMGSMYE